MRRVSVGLSYRTIQDLNDGFVHIPKSSCGSKATRRLAQFLKSRPSAILTSKDSKFLSPPRLEIIPTCGWSSPEAQTATWTHAGQPMTQSRSQCSHSEDHIPIHEREWIDILANEYSHEHHLETRIEKFALRLVRHMDFPERESDGAFRWISITSKLRHAFLKDGGMKFDDAEWIDHIWKGSSTTRFQCFKNSCDGLLYVRAVQGHTGGEVIAPELMGHVAVLFNWKEFIFHRGCAFNSKSIPDAGLIAGGKEGKEMTYCILHSTPCGDEVEEKFEGGLSKPRKVQD